MQILGKFCADVRVQNVTWPRDRWSDFCKLGIKRCVRLERKNSWKGVSRGSRGFRTGGGGGVGSNGPPPPPDKIGLNSFVSFRNIIKAFWTFLLYNAHLMIWWCLRLFNGSESLVLSSDGCYYVSERKQNRLHNNYLKNAQLDDVSICLMAV